MEKKLNGLLADPSTIAIVDEIKMWDDILYKKCNGNSENLGNQTLGGFPSPTIPSVEILGEGTHLLIATKEAYAAYQLAGYDDVLFTNYNENGTSNNITKKDISDVYIIPEEFIQRYISPKKDRQAFIEEQLKKFDLSSNDIMSQVILNDRKKLIELIKQSQKPTEAFLNIFDAFMYMTDESQDFIKDNPDIAEKINTAFTKAYQIVKQKFQELNTNNYNGITFDETNIHIADTHENFDHISLIFSNSERAKELRNILGIEKQNLDISNFLAKKTISKKEMLLALPDDILPDKSSENIQKIIETETLGNKDIEVRFGNNLTLYKTDLYSPNFTSTIYSSNGKKIEEEVYKNDEYDYEETIKKYDENEEIFYTYSEIAMSDDQYFFNYWEINNADLVSIEYGTQYNGQTQNFENYYETIFRIEGHQVSALQYIKAHPEEGYEILSILEKGSSYGKHPEKIEKKLDKIRNFLESKNELERLLQKDAGLEEKIKQGEYLETAYEELSGQKNPTHGGE